LSVRVPWHLILKRMTVGPGYNWLIGMTELSHIPHRLGGLFSDIAAQSPILPRSSGGDLVLSNGADATRVQFPYCESKTEWNHLLQKPSEALIRMTPQALAAIRQYQPFAGNRRSQAFGLMPSADKHNYFPCERGNPRCCTWANRHFSRWLLFHDQHARFQTPLRAGDPLSGVRTSTESTHIVAD
jgi:hypothetical protein